MTVDQPPAPPTIQPAGAPVEEISCYICLARIRWSEQPPMRYNPTSRAFEPIPRLPGSTPESWTRSIVNSQIRCPGKDPAYPTHYLPLAYGLYGPPIVVGFIGAAKSGKTHLLTAMVQAIDSDQLTAHGISARPVDPSVHQQFVRESVEPLFVDHKVLNRTDSKVVTFADAFVLREPGGRPRVVALFDVEGEELRSASAAKQFLFLANALIFVADPEIFETGTGQVLGDSAFSAVMNILSETGSLGRISAAIVLNKADLVRFDDPVAGWLGRPEGIDADQSLRESTDVYAYLYRRGARAWTRPYRECSRSTLHVASATGSGTTGDRYERGVRPRRAVGPLLSVLAMTGVLTSTHARQIGL